MTVVANPLVETKLFAPRLRPSVVARPRLSTLLSRGSGSTMTLISAPAGFGKSTLLADWLQTAADEHRTVAWLSVDDRDREATSFWTYVVAALQRALPGASPDALALLQSGQAPIESVLTSVINELSDLTSPLDLILDDYHLADGPDITVGMTFLIDHLPPPVHLVISTRADPTLPLARLRARGELVEVRAADLRFTADETAAYLNDAVGLELTPADVDTLEERTEGWIAALQLAALSLQGRDDAAGFIAGFAGDDRYVVDYLVEEVLARLTLDVRDFLLQTSILDRLTGPLCDAVTGGTGGKSMLEMLDRDNLFVVRLDDSRRWYRYHHLFGDVLRAHLGDERPDELARLHGRASQWFDAAGEPAAAVAHALEAGHVERAADIVERAIPVMQRARQEATIRGWLDVLPDETVRARPVLAIGLVGGLMSRGEFDDVAARLDEVERQLESLGDDAAGDLVVLDARELDRLPSMIEMYRAALALVAGEPTATIAHADRALARALSDDHLVRAAAAALAGLARWGLGDLEAAHSAYTTAVDGLERAGHIGDVLGCSIALADLRITQGRLGDAVHTLEQALALAAAEPGIVRGTPDMYVGLSQIAWERGDTAAAAHHLHRARQLGEAAGLPQNPYRMRVATASMKAADGDFAGAIALIEEAERVFTSDYSPRVRPVPATRARLLISQGRLDEARRWADEQGLTAEDDLTYVREYEHLTVARLLIAEYTAHRFANDLDAADGLLQRLHHHADAGGRGGTVVEILILQSLTSHARGDLPEALATLRQALTLAEPEGFVRVFLDCGSPMTNLLKALAKQDRDAAYARQLLSVQPGVPDPASTQPSGVERRALVEPLSDRELEVLRLLASDLDGPAIARHLSVSLNTLRTHTKHIYTKLDVNSRRGAVRRARQLSLLPGPVDR